MLLLLLLAILGGFVLGILSLAFFLKSSHTKSMQPTGAPPQQGNMPQNLNWAAIHAAYNNHVAKNGQPLPGQQPQAQVGGTQQPGPAQGVAPAPMAPGNPQPANVPQPQQNQPGYAMLIHAMGQTPSKPGEDHGSMIIRALEGHLKRITPDVSSIHKDTMKPNTGGGAY